MSNPTPGFYKKGLYDITISALLTALLMLLRFLTSMILGVSFTSGIIIFIAAFLSLRIAVFSGICLYLITGAFLGFGIWIPFQILGITAVAVIAYFVPKTRLALCVYAFLSSYLYSFIMLFSMLWFIPLDGIPAYIIAGLPNDTIHSATTVITILLLYNKSLISLLDGYKRTYLTTSQE